MAFAVIPVLAQIEGMIAQVLIEELACHTDARGWVVEPLDETGLARHRNVHVVWMNPARCGNHYHQQSTETVLLVGPALVRWRGPAPLRERASTWPALRFTFPRHSARHAKHRGSPLILASFSAPPRIIRTRCAKIDRSVKRACLSVRQRISIVRSAVPPYADESIPVPPAIVAVFTSELAANAGLPAGNPVLRAVKRFTGPPVFVG